MATVILGTVKWFNRAKGYGVLTTRRGEVSIHVSQLPKGTTTLAPGTRVTCTLRQGHRGWEAVGVQLVTDVPASAPSARPRSPAAPSDEPTSPTPPTTPVRPRQPVARSAAPTSAAQPDPPTPPVRRRPSSASSKTPPPAVAVPATPTMGTATLHLTLIGRPGEVRRFAPDADAPPLVALVLKTNAATQPILPKGVPRADGVTSYLVLLTDAAWQGMAEALAQDPEERLVVKGQAGLDPLAPGMVVVRATTVTTTVRQLAKHPTPEAASAIETATDGQPAESPASPVHPQPVGAAVEDPPVELLASPAHPQPIEAVVEDLPVEQRASPALPQPAPNAATPPASPLEPEVLQAAVGRIAAALGETEKQQLRQIRRIIIHFGLERTEALLAQTAEIEAAGGMPVPDGSRRRSPGGVFFTLARTQLPRKTRLAIFGWVNLAPETRVSVSGADLGMFLVDVRQWEAGVAETVHVVLTGHLTGLPHVPPPAQPSGKPAPPPPPIMLVLEGTVPPGQPQGMFPSSSPTQVRVLIAVRQWRRVAELLRNPKDRVMIDGYCSVDAQTPDCLTVRAQSVMTRESQRAAAVQGGETTPSG